MIEACAHKLAFCSHCIRRQLLLHVRLAVSQVPSACNHSRLCSFRTIMNDSGTSAEPPPRLHRIATLKNFLPLSEDTRAQALPAVMPNSLSRSRPWGRRDSFGSDDPPRRDAGEGEPLRRVPSMGGWDVVDEARERRMSHAASILGTPQMRSQRLIGNSNPRYKWEQYFKSDEELKSLSKPVRSYYKRNNYLIRHYMYIDRLLDSSLPHNLIQEYQHSNAPSAVTGSNQPAVPATIAEEPSAVEPRHVNGVTYGSTENGSANGSVHKVKRTPKDIYRIAKETEHTESSPLLQDLGNKDDIEAGNTLLDLEPDEDTDSGAPIVKIALWVNTVANFVLLIMKIVVVALSSSVSVLASLVDAALDFLCTTIIWITTYLIANNDQYAYPVGRRRLEPVGVLIFAVIMITSFAQVALEGISKLSGPDHTIVRLTPAAIAIMAATVVVKGLCWLWCRLIKNGAVQALAQDAMTE